jgi:hypothetical protein
MRVPRSVRHTAALQRATIVALLPGPAVTHLKNVGSAHAACGVQVEPLWEESCSESLLGKSYWTAAF